jgi:all-trans-retinol 13,14-reductase
MNTRPIQKFDAIVIGSGVGGLSCASALAITGKRVIVLEKNDPQNEAGIRTVIEGGNQQRIPLKAEIGGCMQTLSYKDWKWNLGLQYQAPFSCYMGALYLQEAKLIPMMTDPPVKLKALDEIYQTLKLPDLGDDAEFSVFSDGQAMRDYLVGLFPQKKEQIDNYWNYIQITDKYTYSIMFTKLLPSFWAKLLYPIITEKLKPMLDKNYDEMLDRIFDKSEESNKIKTILNAYWNVLGMPPDSNFLFWTMSDNQLFHGVYVPEGGSKALVDGLLGVIKKNGGELRFGASGAVTEILTTGTCKKKVCGVKVEDGSVLEAAIVVSSVGLPDTIGPLIEEAVVSRRVRRSVDEHICIPTSLILRIGLDLNRNQLDALNVVQKRTYRTMRGTPWEFKSDPTAEGWIPDDIMVLFPKYYATDPGDPALQTAEVVHITDYQKYFAGFKGPDDPAFLAAETRIVDAMHAHFVQEFPTLASHISCMMLTHPFTLKDTIRHKDSSMYGIDAYRTIDPSIQSRTGVKGFYLSGEDTFVNGVTVAVGILTAGCIIFDELVSASAVQIGRSLLEMPLLLWRLILGDPRVKLPERIRKRLTTPSKRA